VAQIVARFPGQPEPEADARMHPAARLLSTLQRVSQHELVPRGERLVVLIDGLDEYDPPADARAGAPGRDPLAEFLPHTLPSGVSLLCASRPRHPYVDTLVERGALQIDLDGAELADDNAATGRTFWEQSAPELGLDAQFTAEAVDRAAGNPQHAEMLRKRLAGLPPDRRRVEDIPHGLAALLARAWDRIATDAAVVDGLGVLYGRHVVSTAGGRSGSGSWRAGERWPRAMATPRCLHAP
jgi:hypothetical protein